MLFLRTKRRTKKNWKELKETKAIKIVLFETYKKKLKRTNKNWKGLHRFSVLIGSLNFSCLKHEYFERFSSLRFFSVSLSSYLFSEWFKPTTRGVHPPSFKGQLISFHLGTKPHFKCWLVTPLRLSSGLDYQNVGGWGDT